MEAEDGARVQFPIIADDKVSGMKYITAGVAETGSVSYNVYTPVAGTFTFLVPGAGSRSADGHGLCLGDGGPEDVFDIGWQSWSSAWQWSRLSGRNGGGVPLALNPRTFVLKAGWHKLLLRSRQAGVSIDGFVITNDMTLVPTDLTFGLVAR